MEIPKPVEIPKITYKDFLRNVKPPNRESPKYSEFWLRHQEYCKSGVMVGGVYISGELYWHLNFFKIAHDNVDEHGNSYREILAPDFRDNEWYIDFYHQKAKRDKNKPIMVFGTRRFAKSVWITSTITRNSFIFKNSAPIIIGGSYSDLVNITDYFDDYYENRQDCFSDYIKIGDWGKATSSNVVLEFNKAIVTKAKNPINPISHKIFPDIKAKPSDRTFGFSKIALRNLEHGKVSSKDELLAGITPTAAIFDEIGKFKYSAQRKALLPALQTKFGERRFVEFLVGTGGSVENSVDAEKAFLNAEEAGFLHCDPNEYRATVKDGYFEYYQESPKKVGLFVPAQMSNAGGRKIEVPLSEYLNREFTKEELKDLEGFNIWVTDWPNALENVQKTIVEEKANGEDEDDKAEMYYPFQPEDCFIHSSNNNFPTKEGKSRQNYLKEKGLTGEYVELRSDEKGNIIVESSELKPVKDYPFKGGSHDAPIIIYERPIFENPRDIKYGTYVAGYDGIKIDNSSISDSVMSFHIFKRTFGASGYQKRIVASFAGRPNIDSKFFRQGLLLLKLYNAECLPESDVNLRKYFRMQNAESLLASAKGTNLRINSNSKASTEDGLPATAKNKQHAIRKVREYCHSVVETGEFDEDGNPITVLGIETIDDVMLLEEIIKFGNYKNYDRIMSFGHALIWDEELSIHNVVGSEKQRDIAREQYKVRNGSLGRNQKYARRNPFRRR